MAIVPEAKFYSTETPEGSMSHILISWYKRCTIETIDDTVEKALVEGVREYLLEDLEFRDRVMESIKKAAAAMPLDVIAEAVRKAIGEMQTSNTKD